MSWSLLSSQGPSSRSRRGFEFFSERLGHGDRPKCPVAHGAAYGLGLTQRHPATLATELDLIRYGPVTHLYYPEYEIQFILKVNRREVLTSR